MKEPIPKQYVINENQEPVAVQLDLKTFRKIEEILENYGLYQLMQDTDSKDDLSLEDAKMYYHQLADEE